MSFASPYLTVSPSISIIRLVIIGFLPWQSRACKRCFTSSPHPMQTLAYDRSAKADNCILTSLKPPEFVSNQVFLPLRIVCPTISEELLSRILSLMLLKLQSLPI